jgi:hypothetical protein
MSAPGNGSQRKYGLDILKLVMLFRIILFYKSKS